MDERTFMRGLIVDSLKVSVRGFLKWFRIHHQGEHLYGVLIDVPSDGDAANILAATEEALDRTVKAACQEGESPDALRAALRWSAPGESSDPWFSPEYEWDRATTHLILLGMDRGLVPRYDTTVKALAVRALAELEQEGVFGTGADRERLYVGVFDIHDDFEDWVKWSAACNPASVTVRVQAELVSAESA